MTVLLLVNGCNKSYHPLMKTPAEVVIAVLGVRPLARSLGVVPATVINWRERGGTVPSKYHVRLIELSEGEITAGDLVYGR